MRRRAAVRLLAAVLTTLSLAGCTTQVAGRPTAGSAPTKDPVAWIDAVCGGLVPFAEAALRVPDLDQIDLPAAQRATSRYVGGLLDGLDGGQSNLDAAGPAPIQGGEALAAKVQTTITRLKTELSAQKSRLDAADPRDPVALGLLFIEIGTTLQEVGADNPLDELSTDARLRAAANQASNCNRLDTLPATSVPTVPAVPLPTPTG